MRLVAIAMIASVGLMIGAVQASAVGPGWVLIGFSTGAVTAKVDVEASFDGPGVLGIHSRSDHTLSRGIGYMDGNKIDVITGDLAVDLLSSGIPFGFHTNLPRNTSGVAVVWVVGGVTAWSWAVSPPGAAIVTVLDSGSGGTFRDGRDPVGGVHAHATLVSPWASASHEATYQLEVEHTFIGVAGQRWEGTPGPITTMNISTTHPDGAIEQCPCLAPPYFADDWGAGTHTLRSDGVEVAPGRSYLLAGVDVPGLPPRPYFS